jgi:hypothetical protein
LASRSITQANVARTGPSDERRGQADGIHRHFQAFFSLRVYTALRQIFKNYNKKTGNPMTDKITSIDINTASPEILETIRKWTVDAGFSIYEENEKRIIYYKDIRFNTAWFLIKEENGKIKIDTWLAPKGMTPDITGNMWKGYKIPVPSGFAIGPNAIYKKLYRSLMEALESNPGSTVQFNKTSSDRPRIKKGTFVNIFIFIGILDLLSGSLNLFNAYNSFAAQYINENIKNTFVTNGIYEIVMGIIFIVIAQLLRKGKLLAIWLYSLTIVIIVVYHMVMGYKFPYFQIIFGALTIALLLELKKNGELS